ncbi:polysaccharide deacetylase family protein [Kitasatospora sp. NPDC051914]|uniref:polysaccharide deacetylase family protein n=1 Tax=Kitasatospora sp. NPDC051914 TaxID=3154945 RepID=UPI003441AEC4
MLSHHQIITRRLLLSVAGMGLLSAAGCQLASHDGGDGAAPAGLLPSDPVPTAPSASAAPSATASASATPSGPLSPQPRRMSNPLFSLTSGDRLVALTLDDGPDPVHTPIVLNILERYHLRATFFLIGENAARQPGLVREIAARGHHIANHTWSHPDLRGIPDATVHDQLLRTSDLLGSATGRAPTWFRAPGGDWSDASLRICAELGMRPMGWSVDPQDWARPGESLITQRVLKAIGPGSIVLNHDGGGDRSQTVAALQTYLPVLIDEGYRFTAPQ